MFVSLLFLPLRQSSVRSVNCEYKCELTQSYDVCGGVCVCVYISSTVYCHLIQSCSCDLKNNLGNTLLLFWCCNFALGLGRQSVGGDLQYEYKYYMGETVIGKNA